MTSLLNETIAAFATFATDDDARGALVRALGAADRDADDAPIWNATIGAAALALVGAGRPTHAPQGRPSSSGDAAAVAADLSRRTGAPLLALRLDVYHAVPVREESIKPQRCRYRRCGGNEDWPAALAQRGPWVAPARLALPPRYADVAVLVLLRGGADRRPAWCWYAPTATPADGRCRYVPIELDPDRNAIKLR